MVSSLVKRRIAWGLYFKTLALSCGLCCVAIVSGCAGKATEEASRNESEPTSESPGNDASNSSTSANQGIVGRDERGNEDPDGNWSQFRGFRTQGTSGDQTVPTEWSDTQNLTWKTELPGRGASSPIVCGDRVFVTAYSGYAMSAESPGVVDDLMYHVLCIDRASGDQLWQTDVKGSPKTQAATERVIDHGLASNTPTTDGEMVYAFLGATGVVAFDMAGDIIWTADVGDGKDNFGSASSPTIYGDLLLVNASIESKRVIAFHKKSGEVAWEISDVIRTWTTPTVYPTAEGDDELVIHATDVIRGFDPKTGEELWTCEGIHDYTVSAPAYHDGVCYFIGGRTKRFIAVRLGGRGDVTETHRIFELPTGANVPSPIYHAGHIYWPTDNGIVYCAQTDDGKTVSRTRSSTKMRVYGSIVRAGDYFYLPCRDKGIVVFPASPQFEPVAENRFAGDESNYNATPAISQGQIFVRTDNYLYCVGKQLQ